MTMKDNDRATLTGKIGVTDSDLNPSGTVLIDNEIYDVETDSEFVEEGRGVRVIRVRGSKILVKRV
jgi:membrane-bound serine protease (ClpP class)